MKTRVFVCLTLLLAAVGFVRADGLIIIRNPPPRPIPRPWPHPVFAPLEVAFHKVEVSIDGQKATTRVEQEFVNPNDANLEGDYIFPIPKDAHIDKFAMRIGDKDVDAELLDAAKARGIYEDIVRSQRDPALLEYTGRAAFRVRIFPIEAHSHKKVSLSYTELLKADGGLVSYTYGLNTEKYSAAPVKTVAVKVSIAQDSPIKALYSPSHQVEIRRDGDRKATVGFEVANARPDKDFQLLFSTSDAEVGLHLLTQKTGADEGWFLLLASAGAEAMKAHDANPKDVLFVFDTSGSMAGKKMEQGKKALAFCLENLNDNDRFEVLRFATETETLFDKLTEATRANRDRALDFVKGLKTIGGTAINDALKKALSLRPADTKRPFIVIFLTDGQPTVGETNEDKIVANVARDGSAQTRVFCFGIGTDVNTHLLDKIAERTRAASQYVLPEEDLELKLSAFFTKIKEPLLTNLKLSFPDSVRISQMYPNPLPDLFRGEQLVLAGRYSGAAEGELALEGLLNGEMRRLVQRVKFPENAWGNEFIPQLWAMRRVGWLLDEIRLRGESRELRDEVVDLARRFAIVTPYTSYLIVEDEARRGVPLTQRSLQTLDKDRVAQSQLRESYDALSKTKAGEVGSYNARANAGLKNADSVSAPLEMTNSESKRSIVAARPSAAPATARRLDELDQQSRVVAGKSFFQNGTQWIDSAAQTQKAVKNQRIQFASTEYFDLLAKNAEAAPWLALGRNVQFTVGDTLYDVFE
jgi:Ca-activated chloride channel family protein